MFKSMQVEDIDYNDNMDADEAENDDENNQAAQNNVQASSSSTNAAITTASVTNDPHTTNVVIESATNTQTSPTPAAPTTTPNNENLPNSVAVTTADPTVTNVGGHDVAVDAFNNIFVQKETAPNPAHTLTLTELSAAVNANVASNSKGNDNVSIASTSKPPPPPSYFNAKQLISSHLANNYKNQNLPPQLTPSKSTQLYSPTPGGKRVSTELSPTSEPENNKTKKSSEPVIKNL